MTTIQIIATIILLGYGIFGTYLMIIMIKDPKSLEGCSWDIKEVFKCFWYEEEEE